MSRKSGNRFSENDMRQRKNLKSCAGFMALARVTRLNSRVEQAIEIAGFARHDQKVAAGPDRDAPGDVDSWAGRPCAAAAWLSPRHASSAARRFAAGHHGRARR